MLSSLGTSDNLESDSPALVVFDIYIRIEFKSNLYIGHIYICGSARQAGVEQNLRFTLFILEGNIYSTRSHLKDNRNNSFRPKRKFQHIISLPVLVKAVHVILILGYVIQSVPLTFEFTLTIQWCSIIVSFRPSHHFAIAQLGAFSLKISFNSSLFTHLSNLKLPAISFNSAFVFPTKCSAHSFTRNSPTRIFLEILPTLSLNFHTG